MPLPKRLPLEVTPIDDIRSTAAYRREVVRVMVSDGLRRAWQRAAGEQRGKGAEEQGRWEEGETRRHGDAESVRCPCFGAAPGFRGETAR